jgi:hypothetical protein
LYAPAGKLSTHAVRQDQPQQPRSCWIGGHFTSPYEQNTQQSPGFGFSTTAQCGHS